MAQFASTPRERELQVAIEQLQQELSESRRNAQALREEATQVCEDQASQLQQAEQTIQSLEEQLSASSSHVRELQGSSQASGDARLHELQLSHSSLAGKLKERGAAACLG
ncbi:MAG: hypothetical protein WDW36_006495 [Sanguina aurantia]